MNRLSLFSLQTIRGKILSACLLLLVIIVGSNLYTYISNGIIVAQQKNLLDDRLKKLLIFETIGMQVALAELESRSFLLFEKEEFNNRRQDLWQAKIYPVVQDLLGRKNKFVVAGHRQKIEKLLSDLTTYEQLQNQTQVKGWQLFKSFSLMDTTQVKLAKDQFVLAENVKQHIIFDAIKETVAYLSSEQRHLIIKESQGIIDSMQEQQTAIIWLILGSLLLSGWISYALISSTVAPLQQLSAYLREVSIGKLPGTLQASGNEIGIMIGAINQLVAHLKASAGFATRVGEGNYTNDFQAASGGDLLGHSLLTMQAKLRQVELDDKKRNWATEGQATFAELLRMDTKDTKALADKLISHLVKYMKANQGGLFVVQAEGTEKHLELTACYAFDRKKFIEKHIEIGEGLVGQAVQEQDTIYLTDVPNNYLQITSGLGGAKPSSVLIVPLKVNGQVYGAIELASFGVFEPNEIAFIEKLSESIASTISTARINQETKRLLEISQQQAEEMRAAEEEMRQNMEELEAIQEENKRKSIEMETQAMAIDAALATIELNLDGTISRANEKFLQIIGYHLNEIQGKHHRMLVDQAEVNSEAYRHFWQHLQAGKIQRGEFKRITKTGQVVWLSATYSPAYDSSGNLIKVIKFAQDITLQVQLQREAQQQTEIMQAQQEQMQLTLQAVETSQEEMLRITAQMRAQNEIINQIAIVSKTDLNGNITYVNDEFLKWSKYTHEEVIGQNHRILKSSDQPEELFKKLWQTISCGKIFRGEIKNKAKDGSFYWEDAIIAPVMGTDGKPNGYLAQCFVIDKSSESLPIANVIEVR